MPDATPHIIVTLNGVDHPIHLDEVTARQVLLVRQNFGMAPRIFQRLIHSEQAARDAGKPAHSVVDTPEIAAFIYLSRLQTEGLNVDVGSVLDEVKIGSAVTLKVERELTAGEVPDLDPPA